jgi:surface antigen
MAEAIVAAPLRDGLSPAALMDLARASILAASLATGTSVAWKAADANGTVTPARDVYLSRHGRACRDLRQALDKSGKPETAAVTLCRPHVGADDAVWEVGDPD